MSGIKLNAFFKFCRVRVIGHMMDHQEQPAQITTEPDKRYRPSCHTCKKPAEGIHSHHERMVKMLDIFAMVHMIRYRYRKVRY